MIKPMWDAKAVKAYETGQGVELVNKPHPHYEPVATKNNDGVTLHLGWDDLPVGTKLYATPPQRTWVGLTDDDRVLIKHDANYNQFMTAGEYAERVQLLTEARLKDKNT
jgi:hypothetical protein